MNDITLCDGEGCLIKKYCERFTRVVYGRRDVFGKAPYDPFSKQCKSFMENKTFQDLLKNTAYKLWEEEGYPHGNELKHWFQARKNVLADL